VGFEGGIFIARKKGKGLFSPGGKRSPEDRQVGEEENRVILPLEERKKEN